MPNVSVFDMNGKKVSDLALAESVFGIEPNTYAMHLCVVNYLANQRQGTQSTRTRSEVSGGGKKPWKQKGTGRARQGSTRAPQWTHGGIAHGPKPREYGFSINKKVRRLAMKSAFSSKVAAEELVVLDEFEDLCGVGIFRKVVVHRRMEAEHDLVVLRNKREVLRQPVILLFCETERVVRVSGEP